MKAMIFSDLVTSKILLSLFLALLSLFHFLLQS